ncbi:hypothetical protein EDF62_3076 [Leucobacter luti]|uniref:Uncharacterized protein n=1 Tax=Leucobacter luti TaxID=340320 RepID=A0A4R6RSD0_9MICO|nr:hypothetical protein EDF62_3076 [Leucobacter luti]
MFRVIVDMPGRSAGALGYGFSVAIPWADGLNDTVWRRVAMIGRTATTVVVYSATPVSNATADKRIE